MMTRTGCFEMFATAALTFSDICGTWSSIMKTPSLPDETTMLPPGPVSSHRPSASGEVFISAGIC